LQHRRQRKPSRITTAVTRPSQNASADGAAASPHEVAQQPRETGLRDVTDRRARDRDEQSDRNELHDRLG
jgi:hypothetical protein